MELTNPTKTEVSALQVNERLKAQKGVEWIEAAAVNEFGEKYYARVDLKDFEGDMFKAYIAAKRRAHYIAYRGWINDARRIR